MEASMPIRLIQVQVRVPVLADGDFRQRAADRRPDGGADLQDMYKCARPYPNPARSK
jgi:hypothetical protein